MVRDINGGNMRGMNRVLLVGNLGKDPEMKVLRDGSVVAKISLATTSVMRLRTGELHTDTQWHTVILWRSLAELAGKYLKKGSLVYLEGKLRTRVYIGKDGQKKYVTEVVGDSVIMLDKSPASKGGDNIPGLLYDPHDDPFPF